MAIGTKPERRLTKKKSIKRPKSSGREHKGEANRTQEDITPPIKTSFDALRSSSATRLQLREHFSSTFPDSELSLVSDSSPATVRSKQYPSDTHLSHHDRQSVTSTYTDNEQALSSNPTTIEEMQSIDVPAAISLLQELKKHATAEELVALHKALLPTRRSVERLDTYQTSYDVSEGRYTSHRRSLLLPGLATRGSDPLQTIEELAVSRKSYHEEKKRKSKLDITLSSDGGELEPAQMQLQIPHRPVSPGEQENVQVGVYRTGTLRITNRSPSPASAMQLYKDLDGANDARGLGDAKVDSGINLTALQQLNGQQVTFTEQQVEVVEVSVSTATQLSGKPFSSSAVSLTAAMDEYSQFVGSPYDRQSIPRIDVDPVSPASSSCGSFKTPVEPRSASHGWGRHDNVVLETLKDGPDQIANGSLDRERPSLMQQGDSGYGSEESSDRPSRSLEDHRNHESQITALPELCSPHSTLPTSPALSFPQSQISALPQLLPRQKASLDAAARPRNGWLPREQRIESQWSRPYTVSHDAQLQSSRSRPSIASGNPQPSPKPQSSFHEDFEIADASQRLEDIFTAPGETRPKSRRQTLLASLGLGKKAENHHDKSEPPEPYHTHSHNKQPEVKSHSKKTDTKKDKAPKKLKKIAPRHIKQARKELAKFDEQADLHKPRDSFDAEEEDQFDEQPDWFWQEDYSVPPVPKPISRPAAPGRSKWQAYPNPHRRRRNLSVVQEVDHDSLADQEDRPQLVPIQSNEDRSEHDHMEQSSENASLHRVSSGDRRSDSLSVPSRATHRTKPSIASSVSSMTSGQMDLIEEVQNATIDWAVQAKFWRARRTLVGHALQQDEENGFRSEDDSDNVDTHQHVDGERETVHNLDKDFSIKFRDVDLLTADQSDFASAPQSQPGSPKRHSLQQVTVVPTPTEASLLEVHRATPDRYSGGLQYEWSREIGVGGSAGTCAVRGIETGRSAPSKMLYGLDLSDVPVFITKRQ